MTHWVLPFSYFFIHACLPIIWLPVHLPIKRTSVSIENINDVQQTYRVTFDSSFWSSSSDLRRSRCTNNHLVDTQCLSTIPSSCRHLPSIHAGPHFSVQTGLSTASQHRSSSGCQCFDPSQTRYNAQRGRSISLAGEHRSLHSTPFINCAKYRRIVPVSISPPCQEMFTHFSHSPLTHQWSESKARDCSTSFVAHRTTQSCPSSNTWLPSFRADEWTGMAQPTYTSTSNGSVEFPITGVEDCRSFAESDNTGAQWSIGSSGVLVLPVSEESFSAIYSRLTSLTISNKWRLLTCARFLLSHTPSLTYLKITGARDSLIDGSRWEELIKTKLPALTKFEFHDISQQYRFEDEGAEGLLNEMIAPFRSPFWTEEKRWLVIGTWHPVDQIVEIYTALVCTPDYRPSWRPNTITMTNFDTQGRYYTKYEDVLHLQVVSCGLDHSINSPVYPNVSELSVAMDRFNSLGSVPAGLDLSNVTKLSLSLSSILPEDEMMFAGLKSLFRQTPNIHTLEFSGRLFVQIDKKPVVQICLAVIDYVDPSKLRYLTLPVIGFHEVRKLLQQFRDLSSVKFDLRGLWTEYGEIVKYLRTLTEDYSIKEDDSSMFVEVCRRPEMTNVENESNGINHREARSLFSNRNRRTTDFSRCETDSLAERTLENTSMDRNWSWVRFWSQLVLWSVCMTTGRTFVFFVEDRI